MFARRTGGTFLAALLVLGLGVSQAPAEDREDARQREAVERAKVKPNDAADIARRVVPDGRVLEVDVETIRGTVTYAVEIEKDRDIRTVLVDLERGEVLSVRSKNEDEEAMTMTTMMTMTGDVPREDQRGVEPSSTPAFEVGSGWMALHATGGSVLPLCIQ